MFAVISPVASGPNWTAIGTFVAAFATLGLAVVTYRMVRATRDVAGETKKAVGVAERALEQDRNLIEAATLQAKAAEQQAKASLKGLNASLQPLLLPVVERELLHDRRLTADDGAIWILQQLGARALCVQQGSDLWTVVPVRNVGPGVALFVPGADRATIAALLYGGFATPGRPSSQVVGPGDVIDVVFHAQYGQGSVDPAMPLPPGSRVAVVTLTYTDVSGSMPTKSELA